MKNKFAFLIICIATTSVAFAQNWPEIQKAIPETYHTNNNDSYGRAVAITDSIAVIGATGHKESRGCAYVLEYNGNEWQNIAILTASDGEPDDLFGTSVCISGQTIVVGAFRHNNTHGAAYVFEKPADGWADMTQTAKLTSTWEAVEAFGASVSISEETIIVGAYMNNLNGSRSGLAYVFGKSAEGWKDTTETATLSASDAAVDGYFGNSVSISGNNIAIGAYGYGGSENGSVYIFEKPAGGWTDTTETAKLTTSDTCTIDNFGYSVSVYDETVVAGAYTDTVNGTNSGSVYVFEKPAGGWTDTTQTAKLTSSDIAEWDYFGYTVNISGDIIVVGAQGDSSFSGAAYIFEKPVGGWKDTTETAKLFASDINSSDYFGRSVSINNETIIIGAHANDDSGSNSGSAYIFNKPVSGWAEGTETQKTLPEPYENNVSDNFGSATAIDGEFAIIGSSGYNSEQGCAYVLEFTGTEWQTLAKLTASDGEPGDYFGSTVDISGETVVVGAHDHNLTGSVYVFEKPVGGWKDTIQTAKLVASDADSHDDFGKSVSISDETIIIGANTHSSGASFDGAAYIFEKPDNGWKDTIQTAKLTASDGAANDNFGISVALSGETAIVGAYGDDSKRGAVYVFEKPAGGWTDTTQTAKLTASDREQNDYFGFAAAISGEEVIVGAYGDDDNGDNTGSVYVFEKPSAGWDNMTQMAKLTVSDTTDFTYFGRSVSISGNDIVAGAIFGVNETNEETGTIYIFQKPETGWTDTTETSTLLASDGNEGDHFGCSVDISGNYLVAGSNDDDDKGTSSGSAYLFVNKSFISLQPEDQSIYDGENASFAVSGITHNSYQWQVDEGTGFVDISDNSIYTGAITENLIINGATVSMDGYRYRCIVSLCNAHDTSTTAILTVIENANGIQEPEKTGIYVFPNPTAGILNFQSEDNVIQCIRVFDLTGKTVFEESGHQNGNSINLSKLNAHIYFLYIQTENKTIITKIIKQ